MGAVSFVRQVLAAAADPYGWQRAARRADRRLAALDGAMHSVWLHGNWRWLTTKMTTEEREAASDAVDREIVRHNADDPYLNLDPVDRWWRF